MYTDWFFWQFGRGDHGRLGYGRKVTTGQPMEVPIDISPPKNLRANGDEGHWIAKLVGSGGRHTLAIMELADLNLNRYDMVSKSLIMYYETMQDHLREH